jgi:hypothetical protein
MILSLARPKLGYQMAQETIHKLIAKPGGQLHPGKSVLEHDLAAPLGWLGVALVTPMVVWPFSSKRSVSHPLLGRPVCFGLVATGPAPRSVLPDPNHCPHANEA